MVKKTDISEFPGPAAKPFTLVKVNQGDRLGWVRISDGTSDILLCTARGMAICFSEEDVRPMGLVAAGVMGIKLKVGDEVIGMDLLPQPGEVFLLGSNGKAKRVPPDDFPKQGRYGQGVVAWKLPAAVRLVGMGIGKGTVRATFHLAKFAAKMARLDDAPARKRTAIRGAEVVEVRRGDRIVGFSMPWDPPRPVNDSAKKTKRTRKKRASSSRKGGKTSKSGSTIKSRTRKAPSQKKLPGFDRSKPTPRKKKG
jgi:DNA gyrase subunit A